MSYNPTYILRKNNIKKQNYCSFLNMEYGNKQENLHITKKCNKIGHVSFITNLKINVKIAHRLKNDIKMHKKGSTAFICFLNKEG